MSDTWKQWEGQILNGQFPLIRYIGGSERSAVFLTERQDGELLTKAAIKLISAASETGERQLSRWQRAAELSHPHLIPVYKMGRSELGGMPLVYVVMEYAEENLAQVLPERALTPDEARAVLAPVLDVLAFLHGKGFVHGRINPANIMAIGDQLKLSSDGLRRAGETFDGPGDRGRYAPPENARGIIPVSPTASPASDVWALGITLVETLTQNLPVARTAEQSDPQLPQGLPEPFLDIARHCLVWHPQGRWTIPQIAARLEGRAPAPQPQAKPAHVRSTPPAVRTPLPAPQTMAPPSRPLAKRRSYAVPIAVGFILALAAILAGPRLLGRHGNAPQAPAAASEQPPVPPAPGQISPPPQKRPTQAHSSSAAKEEHSSEAPVPVPALTHPGAIHEEESSTVASLPAGRPAHGEVAHQVMPEVLQSARDTIRGTVKVRVKVDVDRSGAVENAELESPGPSLYFARAALEAAQLWKFKPPEVNGQAVLSSWTLQFDFSRDETTAVPKQEMP
ncbi:MAG TPA: TonB family protein [Candidatus Acidoferrales bacterium]|nr:TonB family protein [Candidatus Acidoferrales bacterium]